MNLKKAQELMKEIEERFNFSPSNQTNGMVLIKLESKKQQMLIDAEDELKFLEFYFGNEKGYDLIKMKIKELKEIIKILENKK